MTRDIISLVTALLILVAAVAFAQTDPAPVPDPNAGAFEALSPGNQKIAQALFDAQQQPAPGTTPSPTPTTPTTKVYTRDEIAALKQTQGWGQVFKTMQAEGQLEGAKNLGQVVSGKYQPPAPAPGTTPSTQAASGGSTGSTTPQGTEGAFARLSPGNRKIAQALFDAQQQPAPGTTPSSTPRTPTTKVYTRDEIAALKQTQGWGQVFRTMQADGQLQGAKNLGQIVSTKYQAPTTITTASGRTEVVGTGFSGGSSHVALQKHGGTDGGGSGASKGSGQGGSSAVSRGSSGHGRVAHGQPDVPGVKAQGQGRSK